VVGLYLLNDVHARSYFAEYDIAAVTPLSGCGRNKEMRRIRVRTAVRHRQKTWLVVLHPEALIWELGPIYRPPSGPITVHDIAPLDHETLYNPMDGRVGIAEPVFAGCQFAKVASRHGADGVIQAKDYTPCGHAIDGDVEKDIRATVSGVELCGGERGHGNVRLHY